MYVISLPEGNDWRVFCARSGTTLHWQTIRKHWLHSKISATLLSSIHIHSVIVFLPFILAILCVFRFVESGGKIVSLIVYIYAFGSYNKNLVVEENVYLMKICYKRAITNQLHIEGII